MGLSHFELTIETFFVFIAMIIFLHPLKRKNMNRIISILFSILSLFSMVGIALLLNSNGIWFNYVKITLFIIIIAANIILYSETLYVDAIYVAIWCIFISQFTFQIWKIMGNVSGTFNIMWVENQFVLLFFYGFFYTIIFFTIADRMPRKGKYNIGPRQFSSAIMLLLIFEVLYGSVLATIDYDRFDNIWLPVVLAQFYCLSMLYLQTELFKKSAIEQELNTMNLIWQQQKSQYHLNKENIDLINRKCHDLKHQISAIRKIANENVKNQYISEIEDSIQIYNAIIKTGNEVLDTILSEKSLSCEHNDIHIHPIVDGSKLSFIDTVDLYTILGNAIDNAVEAVIGFKNKEMRIIDINIFTKQNFLAITISNPIDKEIEFDDGLPVTTKVKNGYHGYGLKGIKHYVKKYHGHINVAVEKDCFVLKIVIPLPST